MKRLKYILPVLFIFCILISCSKDDDDMDKEEEKKQMVTEKDILGEWEYKEENNGIVTSYYIIFREQEQKSFYAIEIDGQMDYFRYFWFSIDGYTMSMTPYIIGVEPSSSDVYRKNNLLYFLDKPFKRKNMELF